MCNKAKILMNTDTKILFETDLIIQSWEQDFRLQSKFSNTQDVTFDLRPNYPIPIPSLFWDQILWYFYNKEHFTCTLYNVHVLLKIFHDEICWTFFRSEIPILRLFSETKYVLILIQSLFRQPNLQIPILIPWKNWKGLETMTSH